MAEIQKAKLVSNDIYWVGALDYDIRVFDVVMYTKYGTTYNSYVVKGSEKIAIFETVKDKFFNQYLERLKEVVNVTDIDYIVVDHTEPDHAGSVGKLIDLNPNITIVGTGTAINFLKEIVNRPFNSIVAKEGTTINLGDKTIKFIMAPFLHWPDTMYSYIEEDKTLITCDSFGCHYCDENIFNDEIDGDFYDAYKYYFDVIMGPFKSFVIKALDKIKDLELDIICPGHGPILRKDISKYLNYYREWATVKAPKQTYVVIPYVSAYGFTAQIAKKISDGIKSVGDIEVYLYDLVETDTDVVINKIEKAKGILFGSPTIVADALPPIWEVLIKLNSVIHKGKYAGAFGSYGWSGEAVPNIMDRLKQLRFKLPLEGLRLHFKPSDPELVEAYNFGKKFGEEL
ncbi:MAG: FprA family A-type flavoprotein [Eubacteriales bacterium]